MSKVKLGDITVSYLGKMLDAKKNKGTYQPYLANLNVRWGSFDLNDLSLMKFEEHEQERYGLKYGDLIICEGGEPGRCAIWKDELPNIKIQKALHRVRPRSGLDIRYLYYWFLLAGRLNWLNRHFTETTIKHLPGDKLKEIEIDLPKLSVQAGIADVLSSLDDKIQFNNRIIAELESMAKTIYDYWFVQFDFPNAEGNPYCTSGGEMVWNEQLKREIPKGWNTSKIGDLLDKVPNTSRVQSTEYLSSGRTPVIDQSKDYIAGYTNSPDAVISVSDGAIIFGDHTRIVKYIDFDFARGADGTQVLISKNNCVPQLLLYHIINKIDLSNNGYARHYKFLKDISVVIPEKEVSVAFNKITASLYKMITGKIFENLELAKLRDWLLPMLMNGQVTVK